MSESWIKITLFNHEGPGNTDELTGTRHPGDFVGFAAREQALINGLDARIDLGGGQGGHKQGGTQGGMATPPNRAIPTPAGTRFTAIRHQAGEGCRLVRGWTVRKTLGGDQDPGRHHRTNAGDGLQAMGGGSPFMVGRQQLGQFAVERINLDFK